MTDLTRSMINSRRRLADRDGGFAMMSVIMLMLVLTILAIIVLSVVLAQVNPTLFQDKNGRTLAAAQAGVDAAASQIRNAETDDGTGVPMGDIHKLPCVVEGTVDGTGGETSFVAEVDYFVADPVGRDQAWRDSNKLTCYLGTGINGGVRAVPRHAIITSEGFDATSTTLEDRADRVVEASYTFQLTTLKISGGMILDDNGNFCLVAGSDDEWAYITYQPASSAACQEQTELNSWTWAEDYMIHLSSTDLNGGDPMCLTGRASSPTAVHMRLRPCTTSTQDPLGQRFSWTGNHTWRGQNSTNTGYGTSYVVNQDDTVDAGNRLSVSTSAANKSLTPLPAVGKGNASYFTNQVVNYNQFGRCLDVTNETINYAYMIAYPCKQDPSGNLAFHWNHKWYYNEPAEGIESIETQISVVPGSTYCLITPSSSTTVNLAAGGTTTALFPRFVTSGNNIDCSSSNSTWTRYAYSNDDLEAYTIQDRHGRCLSAAGPKTTNHPQWTSIVVETCSGSDDQKWNVDPDPVDAALGDFTELSGNSAG